MTDYEQRLAQAVHHFWQVRTRQHTKQGGATGRKDAGNRSAVTGGKHLDGFIDLFADVLAESGLPRASIHSDMTTLPGYFRPTKDWDLVVVDHCELVASIEFKAHIGPSFGNNFNNRIEEALGSSTDLLTAYREGKFRPSQRPWLGWLMLLEDSPRCLAPVRLGEPYFDVFEEYKGTSYAERYALFCERLLRERFYDAACLLMSNAEDGLLGRSWDVGEELGFRRFVTSLRAHAMARADMRGIEGGCASLIEPSTPR